VKIRLDRQLCEANARCVRECPEFFELADDVLKIAAAEVPAALEDKVRAAAGACPRQALRVRDD